MDGDHRCYLTCDWRGVNMAETATPSGPRLYVEADLAAGAAVALSGRQAHYLSAVMRRRPGDRVRLFNGRHGEWSASLVRLERTRAEARPELMLKSQVCEPPLSLAFAMLKRENSEIVVQKATELGVTALQPVLSERSQGLRLNTARMSAIAVEAAEQSERLTVPRVEPVCSLLELLAAWPSDRPLAAAIERSGTAFTPARAEALLIGPEGGFSRRELDVLAACSFVRPTSLGPTVLRAETAAIVGLTVLLITRQDGGWPAQPAVPPPTL